MAQGCEDTGNRARADQTRQTHGMAASNCVRILEFPHPSTAYFTTRARTITFHISIQKASLPSSSNTTRQIRDLDN